MTKPTAKHQTKKSSTTVRAKKREASKREATEHEAKNRKDDTPVAKSKPSKKKTHSDKSPGATKTTKNPTG